jgi:hypothetical protein
MKLTLPTISISFQLLVGFLTIFSILTGRPVNAQPPADPTRQALEERVAAYEAATKLAEAKTAEANAEKAQAEAKLAAMKAQFGEIPDSGYSGAVTVGTSAGTAEAMLLGATTVNYIAKKFATQIVADYSNHCNLVLTTSTTVSDFNFQAWTVFHAQKESLRNAVEHARNAFPLALEPHPGFMATEGAAGIGLALDAINKILAYAKTDYSFTNIDVTSNDAMLLSALTQSLQNREVDIKRKVEKPGNPPTIEEKIDKKCLTVLVPSLYLPAVFEAANAVLEDIKSMYKCSSEMKSVMKYCETRQAEIVETLNRLAADISLSEADKKRQQQTLKTEQNSLKEELPTAKATLETADAWIKQLTIADDKGNIPLGKIIWQTAVKKALDNPHSALVVIQLHKVGGTGYTKKNLLSSLGMNPFFVMGGAVAGYVALDGKTGSAFSAMLMPLHGGYHSVSKIEKYVNPKEIVDDQGKKKICPRAKH